MQLLCSCHFAGSRQLLYRSSAAVCMMRAPPPPPAAAATAQAGQTVPHSHVHILPRKAGDFGGHNDAVYDEVRLKPECYVRMTRFGMKTPINQGNPDLLWNSAQPEIRFEAEATQLRSRSDADLPARYGKIVGRVESHFSRPVHRTGVGQHLAWKPKAQNRIDRIGSHRIGSHQMMGWELV